MRTFLILLGLPLAEIAGFVLVGGWIGLWPTLGLVVLAGIAGVALLKAQGVGALAEARRGVLPRDPLSPMLHRLLLAVAGVLLIVPGFVTDLAALPLLIPAVRRLLIARVPVQAAFVSTPPPQPEGEVIEGEWIDLDAVRRPGGRSGWTRLED